MAALLCAGALLSCSSVSTMLNLFVPTSGYTIKADLAYGDDPRQRLDLYVPDGLKSPAPVMLFFYGGAWQSGTKDLYRALGQTFASAGIVVAVADYRLYPQVKYPEFVRDGAMALRFVHDHAGEYGGDPARVFVAGHSAGAYIAVMLASDPQYTALVGGNLHWIRGAIGIAGPYDFLPLRDKNLIAIFGGANRADTQPISYIDGKRPPMLLVTGSDDSTVYPANTRHMAERLKRFGNEPEVRVYESVSHIGIILSLAPSIGPHTSLREDMLRFIAASRE